MKDLLKQDLVLKMVAASLNDRDGNVRAAALGLVASRKYLHRRSTQSQPSIACIPREP